MELVYLWVDSYKNIKKQGFNFSPRFECSYENGYLDIKDKEEIARPYLKNFFGDNINITAIVGENGSGKSRILECIEKIILANDPQELDDFKYALVYYDNVPLSLSNVEINTSIKQTTVFSDVCSLVYKYHISKEEIHQAQYYTSANLHYETLHKQGIVNILSAKQNDMNSFHISSFMYEPIKVEISLRPYEKLVQKYISFITSKKQDEIEKILNTITDSYQQYLSICYISQKGSNIDSKVLKNKELLIQNIINPLSLNDFMNFFISVMTTKEYKLSKMSPEQKNIYFNEDYWHYFEFDFIDEKERRYNDLSHGEKVIFSQLLSIFFYASANEKLLFLFDEPEIALHPNWQKQYLNEVINLLKKIQKKYHFMFTTHSAFLLSDLSKQNIIYLEKDEESGKCINTTNTVKINPFGANIHTLLSYGFFMQDGLMGEFAKNKINEIIDFLNNKKTIDEISTPQNQIKKVIEIIGEDFLKEKLLNMYNTKYPKSKDERILELQKQIDELNKK